MKINKREPTLSPISEMLSEGKKSSSDRISENPEPLGASQVFIR